MSKPGSAPSSGISSGEPDPDWGCRWTARAGVFRMGCRWTARAGVFRIRDQPVDRPPLDLVGRPRSLISGAISRAGARAPREGKCWRFYAPADPLQAALRLAPLIIPVVQPSSLPLPIRSVRAARTGRPDRHGRGRQATFRNGDQSGRDAGARGKSRRRLGEHTVDRRQEREARRHCVGRQPQYDPGHPGRTPGNPLRRRDYARWQARASR